MLHISCVVNELVLFITEASKEGRAKDEVWAGGTMRAGKDEEGRAGAMATASGAGTGEGHRVRARIRDRGR